MVNRTRVTCHLIIRRDSQHLIPSWKRTVWSSRGKRPNDNCVRRFDWTQLYVVQIRRSQPIDTIEGRSWGYILNIGICNFSSWYCVSTVAQCGRRRLHRSGICILKQLSVALFYRSVEKYLNSILPSNIRFVYMYGASFPQTNNCTQPGKSKLDDEIFKKNPI